jgi:Protein of unknown function (DUF3631)/Domain of unknown function (DUF3854)
MSLCEDYLLARGLMPEIVTSYGVEIDLAPDRARTRSRLGDGCPMSYLLAHEILWFPVKNKSGALASWIARPFSDIKKGAKFVCPVGSSGPPFIAQKVFEIADKAAVPFVITEGPVKAIACIQAGCAAVGLNGVWSSAEKTSTDQLILRAELRSEFRLGLRKVYLLFDADIASNTEVRRALIRLSLLLWAEGAEVYQMTRWDAAQGTGIDDFLCTCAKEGQSASDALGLLMTDATPFMDTIKPTKVDLDSVLTELVKVQLGEAHQCQLCKEFAKRLNIPAAVLRKHVQEKVEDTAHAVQFDGALEPWTELVQTNELLSNLVVVLQRHIVMSDECMTTVALWILLSYITDSVAVLPILGITSPEKRCGKTRLLTILAWFTQRSLPASNVSAAAVYRVIERWCPTILVDEADTFLKDHEDLRGVFNSGHMREFAFVLRANRENGHVERFSTWAAKAIAQIGKLPPTIADRSVQVKLSRRTKDEPVRPLRKTLKAEVEMLRRKLIRWASDYRDTVASTEPFIPDTLNDRAADNWYPLLAIATVAGDTWLRLANDALNALNQVDEDEESITSVLLTSLRTCFGQHDQAKDNGFVSTTDILKYLNPEHSEAPWADWGKGEGITATKLAKLLRRYPGVKSTRKELVIGAGDALKKTKVSGYEWKELAPVFERYLRPAPPEESNEDN